MPTSRTDKPPVCLPTRTDQPLAPAVSATDIPTFPLPASVSPPTPPPLPAASSAVARSWPSPAPAAPGTLLHWVFLLLAAAVMFASLSLRVRDGHQVIVPLVNEALPGTCTFRTVTGIPCPGCGLTRSFISLGHGQLLDAWHYNPAGFVFFAVVAFQIPYRIVQIMRIRRGCQPHRFEYVDHWVLVLLVVALVVQWVCGLAMRVW